MPSSDTRWKPGQSGNPAGRPKGSRDEFNEAFIRDLKAAWEARGVTALAELSATDFARIAVQVLSKESKVDIEHSGAVEHRGLPEIGERVKELLRSGTDSDSAALLSH